MRKLIYSIATIVLLVSAVFVWSRTSLVSSRATVSAAGTIETPQQGSLISPFDMMVKYGKPLPTQSYDAH
jgi:hypothetical protein